MILNIRGTGGSGKSTLVRQVMKAMNSQPIEQDGKVVGYQLDRNVRVLGRYTATGGGTDGIGGPNVLEETVRAWAKESHIIFENYMASGHWARWVRVSEDQPDFIWAFLDTPAETCFARILGRNGGKVVSWNNMMVRWECCRKHEVAAAQLGFTVRNIRYAHALADTLAIIAEGVGGGKAAVFEPSPFAQVLSPT